MILRSQDKAAAEGRTMQSASDILPWPCSHASPCSPLLHLKLRILYSTADRELMHKQCRRLGSRLLQKPNNMPDIRYGKASNMQAPAGTGGVTTCRDSQRSFLPEQTPTD